VEAGDALAWQRAVTSKAQACSPVMWVANLLLLVAAGQCGQLAAAAAGWLC
jgi:hypothetical protein